MALHTLNTKKMLAILLCIASATLLCACGSLSELFDRLPPLPTESSEEAEDPAPVESLPPEMEAPADVPAEPPPEPEEIHDTYIVKIAGTPYRSEPKTEQANVLGSLSMGDKVACIEDEGEFMLVELSDGQQVWCASWYLKAEDAELEQQRAESFLAEKTGTDTYVPIDGEPVYYCTATVLNCRAEPSTTCTILYQIVMGSQVNVLGRDGDFYLCRLPNSGIAYCSVNYLSSEATYVDLAGAVDLRVFMPGAEFDLLFASPNNITGEAMYPPIPLLEETTAEKLMQAYNIFREDGYAIKIYDAYRPKSAQYKLYDIVQDSRFIANPYTGNSWHQRGRAVDISLVNLATGEELEMPTPMHTFSLDAARSSYKSWSVEAQKNVDYMTKVMTSVGFGTLETEWWHFEYTGPGGMMEKDIDFGSLTYRPVSEYVPRD
ncbi:MAG: M15 family metallopeptidase [Candidatus Limivicinus sp.]|nr:M15 family metallopeptidase [Candidatus Limivicinus sp.]